MRRATYLALTLLLAASAAALIGQQSAAAQPLAIQVIATGPNTFQVSVNFNTDELPVSFTAANPMSGPAATVTSLGLVSCTHYALGNCTFAVADTDPSATAYNSGAGLANFEAGATQEPVAFVVAVAISCSTPSTVVVVASQGGVSMSAPLACGTPADSLSYAGQFPYLLPFNLYLAPLTGQGLYINEAVAVYPGTPYLANRPPYLGAGIGGIVFGASGTQRNLARHALQQVTQLLPAYLAAYGADPALGPVISQQIAAYANAYSSNPPSLQQIMQQIPALIAAYGGAGPSFTPPRTGEAGYVELYPDAEYPMVTYFSVAPPEEIADTGGESVE